MPGQADDEDFPTTDCDDLAGETWMHHSSPCKTSFRRQICEVVTLRESENSRQRNVHKEEQEGGSSLSHLLILVVHLGLGLVRVTRSCRASSLQSRCQWTHITSMHNPDQWAGNVRPCEWRAEYTVLLLQASIFLVYSALSFSALDTKGAFSCMSAVTQQRQRTENVPS